MEEKGYKRQELCPPCFSFHGINPRTKHLINRIHWSSSRSGEIWNERQSPQSTRLQGCPGAGIPLALLSGKPPILIFSTKLQPICLSFFPSCCVCSPRFKMNFVRAGSFRSCVPLEISWTCQCVTQALLWLVHQQSRSFQGHPSFKDWDTKFGQIESSQGPHIQGYILLKMYKNWYNSWTKFSKALSDHTSLILILQ